MTCHPTDPRMAEFEGYERTAAAKQTRECAGAIALVTREALRFQAICSEVEQDGRKDGLREYRRRMPKGMTREGLAELVSRFLFGGTPFAREIQMTVAVVNDPDVGYPPLGEWDPGILSSIEQEHDAA